MSREYPDRPILGVGGIVFSGNRVLLARRGREPGKGQWSIPGGAVKVGETLEQAVVREFKEETGLSVRPLELITTLERIFRDQEGRVKYHYVLCDYLCQLQGGTLTASSDVDETVFAPVDSLHSYRLPQVTLEVIEKSWERLQPHLDRAGGQHQ